MTEAQYNAAIAIYHPTGGRKVGKIYDIRDTDNTSPNDLTVSGGGGTRFLADGTLETVPFEMPKIDYSTGQAAFLIEPARTNYISDQNINFFEKSGATVSVHPTIKSPIDGDAYHIQAASVGASAYVYLSGAVSSGQVQSIFIRSLSGVQTIAILNHNSQGVVQIDENWKRFEALYVAGSPGATNFYAVDFRGGSTTDVLVALPQLEDGINATTPIITNGSAVTRTALSASITVPAGVTSIEEKVDGVVNTITTIPATYTMPNGALEYVKFL